MPSSPCRLATTRCSGSRGPLIRSELHPHHSPVTDIVITLPGPSTRPLTSSSLSTVSMPTSPHSASALHPPSHLPRMLASSRRMVRRSPHRRHSPTLYSNSRPNWHHPWNRRLHRLSPTNTHADQDRHGDCLRCCHLYAHAGQLWERTHPHWARVCPCRRLLLLLLTKPSLAADTPQREPRACSILPSRLSRGCGTHRPHRRSRSTCPATRASPNST